MSSTDGVDSERAEAAAVAVTYADGTTATGPAPLPDMSPQQQLMLTHIDVIEAMLRGANGPTIQLRGFIKSLAATSTMPADGVKDPFVIYLDADPIDVGQVYRAKGFQFLPPNPTMSGAEIRSCGWKKNNYQMYIDATPMQPVGDTEAIPLKSGMKFFCIPEANW